MTSVIRTSASNGTEPIGILRLLFWLRAFAIVAQCAAVWVAQYVLAAPLPIRPIVITVGALALWNVLGYRDLYSDRRVQHREVALHLIVDVAAFTSMIYFTGGYTNPFVSLYLLPISLAAASLPAAYAWSIGALCGVCYSLVWRWHVPLPPVNERFGSDFDLHVAGMWVNFLIAATLIVFFVGRTARVLRRRDQRARRAARERRCATSRSSSSARSPPARRTSSTRRSRRSRFSSRSSTSRHRRPRSAST